jgi:hypothetical protein
MKKLSIFVGILFILGSFSSAVAIDRTGTFAVGGHCGYSFGFGNIFDKYEVSGYELGLGSWSASYQNKVTYSFWGNVRYGLNPNWTLMASVDYQAGDVEASADIVGLGGSVSDSYHWTSILGNALVTLTPEKNTCPYFTFGGGIYFNEDISKPGVNLGGGIEHFFQENLALDAGARYHMIFTENDNTNYLNVYGGINYYIGVK